MALPFVALKSPGSGAISVQGARRARGAAAGAKRGRVGGSGGASSAGLFRAAARPVAAAHTETTEPTQSQYGARLRIAGFPVDDRDNNRT